MDANLSALRQLAFDRLDWAPTASTDAKARVNRAINRALMRLAEDCPFAFFESHGHMTLQPDYEPTTDDDTVSVVDDAWVVWQDLVSLDANYRAWTTDGTWDGRVIEIKDSDGVWHEHRIRAVTAYVGGKGAGAFITLYEPWHGTSAAALEYRISSDRYFLPGDVLELKSARIIKDNQNWPLKIVGQHDAEAALLAQTNRNQPTGAPRYMFRREPFGLPAPTFTPTVAATAPPLTWDGPEPAGKFDYCFTYCWGRRPVEWQNPGPRTQAVLTASSARMEPLWESPPSPVGATITVTFSGASVTLTLPDIDFMQGFGDNTTERYATSGWYKRIYRRRYTAVGGSNPNIEAPDAYYLLDEAAGYDTTYEDDGSVTPDYHRRLREDHSYQAVQFYVRPDIEYEVDLRYVRRPPPLKDDADVPYVHADALAAVIHLTVAFLHEAQGNRASKLDALAEYADSLVGLKNRYGDLRSDAVPMKRRLARAGVNRRLRGN